MLSVLHGKKSSITNDLLDCLCFRYYDGSDNDTYSDNAFEIPTNSDGFICVFLTYIYRRNYSNVTWGLFRMGTR